MFLWLLRHTHLWPGRDRQKATTTACVTWILIVLCISSLAIKKGLNTIFNPEGLLIRHIYNSLLHNFLIYIKYFFKVKFKDMGLTPPSTRAIVGQLHKVAGVAIFFNLSYFYFHPGRAAVAFISPCQPGEHCNLGKQELASRWIDRSIDRCHLQPSLEMSGDEMRILL